MSNFIKQPSIKLIPSDPMTNTILIIYCVSSTGASVPYKSSWRKINPKKNKIEQIKNNNSSSYRCSPLDIDCLIEATVYFQHQNVQLSRVVQSNMVKVSRELKERKMHMREPILSRIAIDEVVLESKMYVQDDAINIMLAGNNLYNNFALQINDINIQVDNSHLIFKIIFKEKFQNFLDFTAKVLGWKPQPSSNIIHLTFGSDINRDIILLGVAQYLQKCETVEKLTQLPLTGNNYDKYQQKQTGRDPEQGGHSKNKSQTSFSPSGAYKQKFKLGGKLVQMKRSFNNLHNGNQQTANEKKNENIMATPEIKQQPKTQQKIENKDKMKQREYLNVFQDDELELLEAPRPVSFDVSNKFNTKIKPQIYNPNDQPQIYNPNDQPSINLRGSFEELQKSFNSKLNEEMVDKMFKIESVQQSKKLNQEIGRLQKENQHLKKQVENVSILTKQHNTLKKKYNQMKQEINRLEMQRKVILTDKLRCEVNWHKQIQEKEQMKKELQYLRQAVKANGLQNNYNYQRNTRTQSIHDVPSFDRRQQNKDMIPMNRDMNRSPNNSFYR